MNILKWSQTVYERLFATLLSSLEQHKDVFNLTETTNSIGNCDKVEPYGSQQNRRRDVKLMAEKDKTTPVRPIKYPDMKYLLSQRNYLRFLPLSVM